MTVAWGWEWWSLVLGENWRLWWRDGVRSRTCPAGRDHEMCWCQNVWNTAKAFLRGFSPKMLTNLGESPGEPGVEVGGNYSSPGNRHWWQLPLGTPPTTWTLVAGAGGAGHHCRNLLPAQPYDIFKNLVWLVPFMFFIQTFLW